MGQLSMRMPRWAWAEMHLGFPFSIRDGSVAQTDQSNYVEQLIELVLFTMKGERVNLPEFGCGIEQMVFQPVDSEVLAAVLFVVQSVLQRFLAGDANIHSVDVIGADDGKLLVNVDYSLAQSPVRRVARYRR